MMNIFLWFNLVLMNFLLKHISNIVIIKRIHYLYVKAGEDKSYDCTGRHWSKNVREWDKILREGDPIYQKLSKHYFIAFLTFFLTFPIDILVLNFLLGDVIKHNSGKLTLFAYFLYMCFLMVLDKIDRIYLEKKIKNRLVEK